MLRWIVLVLLIVIVLPGGTLWVVNFIRDSLPPPSRESNYTPPGVHRMPDGSVLVVPGPWGGNSGEGGIADPGANGVPDSGVPNLSPPYSSPWPRSGGESPLGGSRIGQPTSPGFPNRPPTSPRAPRSQPGAGNGLPGNSQPSIPTPFGGRGMPPSSRPRRPFEAGSRGGSGMPQGGPTLPTPFGRGFP